MRSDWMMVDSSRTILEKSPVKETPTEILDYNHINAFDIQIDVDSFQYTEGKYTGEVSKLALEDVSGFVLNNLTAKEATVYNRRVELNGVKLVTPYSTLGDTLIFKYREFGDFLEFPNKVLMETSVQ